MVPFITAPVTGPTQSGISDLITAPQRVRTDEGTVEERPIAQIIQGDVYNKLSQPTAAMQGPLWGIACAVVRPPDALGSQGRGPFVNVNRML